MFIQVPESVNKSLRNGIAPRTQIHFPNASLENGDSQAILTDNCIHRLRNEMFARRECGCGTDGITIPVTGPNRIPWRPPMLPSHESYRRSREVCNNLLLTPYSSPSMTSVTGVTDVQAQSAVAKEQVGTPAWGDDHSEEDEIESLESPRSFASSGSNSSRDDILIQFPEMQSPGGRNTPAPKPRSQQSNPWGKASYSDLITMAITSTGNNMMTLSEIYGWIVKNVPYFNDKGTYLSVQGWKVSLRQISLDLEH